MDSTRQMRSYEYLSLDYWPAMCERAFPGLSMSGLPKAQATEIDQAGVDIAIPNVYFTNGTEDPW